MRTNFIFFLLLATSFVACKNKKPPKPEKQYSTWIVNNQDTFRTNNVDSQVACNPDHSYCVAGLMSKDSQNWFNIAFFTDKIPTTGQWPLGNFLQNPTNKWEYVFIYFYYNGKGGYIPAHPELDTLYITSINGKISYKLNEMWFVDNNNLNDSILVQGTFNIP